MLVLNGGEGVHCAEEEERGAEEDLHNANRVCRWMFFAFSVVQLPQAGWGMKSDSFT